MADTTSKEEKARIDAFLNQPLLARLATLNPKTLQPHVTPVWYAWDGECIWFSGFRSTRKFKELYKNPRCSIVVDEAENSMASTGVIFEGQVELIEEPRQLVYEKTTWIYLRYLDEEGVQAPDPQSWIYDPENVIAKLAPERIYTWFPGK
jgi:nitroimidazol reductase NimA-like FMN-containing flavoprotein (pyridoxamine 5'-phosphate oxidase superfamily)